MFISPRNSHLQIQTKWFLFVNVCIYKFNYVNMMVDKSAGGRGFSCISWSLPALAEHYLHQLIITCICWSFPASADHYQHHLFITCIRQSLPASAVYYLHQLIITCISWWKSSAAMTSHPPSWLFRRSKTWQYQ